MPIGPGSLSRNQDKVSQSADGEVEFINAYVNSATFLNSEFSRILVLYFKVYLSLLTVAFCLQDISPNSP
jgi:hypothetical protein